MWGFDAAIVCVVFADLPRYVVLGLGCRSDGLHIFRTDAWRTGVLGAAAGAGLLFLRLVGSEGTAAVAAACVVSLAAWIVGNREAARWYLAKARGALVARRA